MLEKLPDRRPGRACLLLSAALLLSACGASSVQVEGDYPTPSVRPMPLTLGVYYDEALRGFSYTEEDGNGNAEYVISSGDSHVELFNTILPAMFQDVVVLDDPANAADAGVDAVFLPAIDEYQLALPQKTRLDVYEVWLRYNMRLEEPDGDYIADWVLTAYGKTPRGTFGSAENGINNATVEALRDLASSFTLGFSQVPDVNDWLQARAQ